MFMGGCRIFEREGSNLLGLHARGGGVQGRVQASGGGGFRGGSKLLGGGGQGRVQASGPMLKSLHRGPKGGVPPRIRN